VKVRPAVLAVSVERELTPEMASANAEDSPSARPDTQKFLHEFGLSDPPQRHQRITALGSGFFISADGCHSRNRRSQDHAASWMPGCCRS
jgi:S1-C subfamily serine protease